jgi:carbohydrate kinase (thermoresistant glucokinase family)
VTRAIVVMGVTGSGKSTLGCALAAALGWRFIEGDTLHPRANIAKMTAGTRSTMQTADLQGSFTSVTAISTTTHMRCADRLVP